MTSKARSLATAIRRSPVLSAIIETPTNTVAFAEALTTATGGVVGAGGGGSESVATAADLPLSGNEVGDFAFVQETNRLYIWNGQGWYNIALVNTSPSFTQSGTPSANYILDSNGGSPLILTLQATDPEEVAIQWSYLASDSSDYFATIQQTDNTFTITSKPKATIQEYYPTGGSFSITFRASDGINVVPSISTFKINISTGNVYSVNSQFPKTFTQSPTLNGILQNGSYSGDIAINYDGTAIVTGSGSSNPVPGNSVYTGDGGLSFLYKNSNNTWVRTANGQHANYYSNAQNAVYGNAGVAISTDGKRALATTGANISSTGPGTWYRYYYDYTVGATDGADTGSVTFTSHSYNHTPSPTNVTGFLGLITSPLVKEIGSRYSYCIGVGPYVGSSSASGTGNVWTVQCDELAVGDGFSFQTRTINSNNVANYNSGLGGGAINHQGDRFLICSKGGFDYYAGTYPNLFKVGSTLSTLGGYSASSISNTGGGYNSLYRMRFDVNKKLYMNAGPKILIFDLSSGLSSDLNSYQEINLSQLLSTSTIDGTSISWSLSSFTNFSVSYNGDYILALNYTNGRIYVLNIYEGQWVFNCELAPPSGMFGAASMSADASTIVGRTLSGQIYVYNAETPG
jgi:hypothetical protein